MVPYMVPGFDSLILAFQARSSRQPNQLQPEWFRTFVRHHHVAVSP